MFNIKYYYFKRKENSDFLIIQNERRLKNEIEHLSSISKAIKIEHHLIMFFLQNKSIKWFICTMKRKKESCIGLKGSIGLAQARSEPNLKWMQMHLDGR